MTPSSLPQSKPTRSWKTILANISDKPGHPVQIALRAYTLCLSLSLGPVLLPLVFTFARHPKRTTSQAGVLWRTLATELQPTGFASAITVAIAGGVVLQQLWDSLECRSTQPPTCVRHVNAKLSLCQRAFLANAITSILAVTLLHRRRPRRPGALLPTLDLTLLLFVRALDALVQAFLLRKAREVAARQSQPSALSDVMLLDERRQDLAKEWQKKVASRLDALIFSASSARIMWCFFYQPQRLPSSYVKWIGSLANVDERLLAVLRALREGRWSYIRHPFTSRDIVGSLAQELGHSPSRGDPTFLPAYGGKIADNAWKMLGVDGRSGVGGLPCGLVHGSIGAMFGLQNNCLANASIRAICGFAEALIIYLPVHLLPILLAKSSLIMRPRRVLLAFQSAVQSAAFLSSFLFSCWFGVCFTRTLALARLFPYVSHDVWDGPYGGTLVGSLACGTSIWIENTRRKREMALYVLPKALRASISEKWLRSRHPAVQFIERLTFIVSLASLLTVSVHRPESLRGLSRWTLSFVMNGPNSSFRKMRKGSIATYSGAPVNLSTVDSSSCED